MFSTYYRTFTEVPPTHTSGAYPRDVACFNKTQGGIAQSP